MEPERVCLRYTGPADAYTGIFAQQVWPGEFIRAYPPVPGELSLPQVRASYPCRQIDAILAECIAQSEPGRWEVVSIQDMPAPVQLPDPEPVTDADGDAIADAILEQEE